MSDIFSPSSLSKALHKTRTEALNAIPDGDTKALIIDGTYSAEDGAEARIVYVQRAPKGWNVLAEAAYNGEDGPSAGVAIARSWK